MSLKDKLKADLTESIRSRDELKSSTIRMILTSITNEEVSGKEARTLTDAEIITVLSREAKKRREAAEAFDQGGAKDGRRRRKTKEKEEGRIRTRKKKKRRRKKKKREEGRSSCKKLLANRRCVSFFG